METEVKDSEETLKYLSDRRAVNHTDLHLEENEVVENTIFGMKSFGKIKLSTEKKTISFDKDKPITAQTMLQNIFPKQIKLK